MRLCLYCMLRVVMYRPSANAADPISRPQAQDPKHDDENIDDDDDDVDVDDEDDDK